MEEDIELNNINSPASYFNISSRAPLHSNSELDSTLENDISPLTNVVVNEKKRKVEDLLEQEEKSSKVFKFWNIMKNPFQKITNGTITDDENISISTAVLTEKDKSIIPEMTVNEADKNNLESENKNTDVDTEVQGTSVNTTNKRKLCSIM